MSVIIYVATQKLGAKSDPPNGSLKETRTYLIPSVINSIDDLVVEVYFTFVILCDKF